MAKKGQKLSKETKAKISASLKGRKLSEETKKKISKSCMGRVTVSGPDHYAWKGGGGFIYHEGARKDHGTDYCQECGITIEEYKTKYEKINKFDMHCLKKDFRTKKKEDWRTLCKSCHLALHAELRVMQKAKNDAQKLQEELDELLESTT